LLNFPHKGDIVKPPPLFDNNDGDGNKVEYRFNQITGQIEPIEPLSEAADS
jgi:hypothetical protein